MRFVIYDFARSHAPLFFFCALYSPQTDSIQTETSPAASKNMSAATETATPVNIDENIAPETIKNDETVRSQLLICLVLASTVSH